MSKNKLTIKVDADTTEALKQMKEVTEAANECVVALEKLEKVMNRFKDEPKVAEIKVNTILDSKVKASDIIQRINAAEEIIHI
ncbi:TPA: hypothetical protein SUB30_004787 [Bacillus pseudomycoides]|nr:hypothetical protein [Bacillus pseudomycoides]